MFEELRLRFLLEAQFLRLTKYKGKGCSNFVLDDCSFSRRCIGSSCTSNHTFIFVRLPCDVEFPLGNNFKEAFRVLNKYMVFAVAAHMRKSHGIS